MEKIKLIATTTFGLEAVVKRELFELGYTDLEVENGRITFKADVTAIPRTNLWLRSADRVLLRVGEFNALSFEELFEKTKALPWDEWITEDGKFTVTGKSVKSKLYSVPDCQSIVKKAIVEKLKEKYQKEWFEETGAEFTVQVSLLKDMAALTIDTSGVGLHKRGYRKSAVEAPLKETLAAALVQLSFWNKERLLLDPLCGSGTIPIEAALIGRNIAPGLNRSFASETWPRIGKELWKQARLEAFKAIDQESEIEIIAADIDSKAVELAEDNAVEAGVDDCIKFSCSDLADLRLNRDYGVLICNPPYGERIGQDEELRSIYAALKKGFGKNKTWSIYVITSDDRFENIYGSIADKKRKLYNGRIKVNYYQFFGARPPIK